MQTLLLPKPVQTNPRAGETFGPVFAKVQGKRCPGGFAPSLWLGRRFIN